MNQPKTYKCTVCQSKDLRISLTFGKQPPSNRFLPPEAGNVVPEDFCRLSLGYCQQCGTIQLVDRMPIEVVRPRYDWLVYNEPERHLDDVASKLVELSGINASSRFLGITYKDKSTLDRIERLGFPHTACISEIDLQCSIEPFGLETIQDTLSDDSTIVRLREIYGRADVVLVRHIIEHASDASNLIRSLRGLLAPNGIMMFELPDSEKFIRANNHAFIWEEHISYFTATSVSQLAKAVEADLVWLRQFPYPYEDSLIALFRFSESKEIPAEVIYQGPEVSASVLEEFATGLHISCEKWRKELEAYRAKNEKVAVFGAGHLTAKFINLYGLKDLIDCVIDDHPKKVGMAMPGSGLEVVPSAELFSRGIRVCVSTLSPESEIKVRGKLTSFFEAGGCFIPAFAIL
jgi:hypothetical protein